METVARGLGFPEGPIAMQDGSVLLVEIRNQCLTRVAPDGTKSVVAHLGGGPNGAAIGPDGAVYIANNGGFVWHDYAGGEMAPHGVPADYAGGSIQRCDPKTGSVSTLYVECDGRKLSGPNDLVFDRHGGFYFTDFGKGTDEWESRGQLYYALPDGSRIVHVRGPLNRPNGVGLSPDEKVVYVAESFTARLWAFDIIAPGVVAPPRDHMTPGRHVWNAPGYQVLDSLAVEEGGNICIATVVNGGINVVSPTGSAHHVAVPAFMVTNICFGGPERRTAWITAGGSGELFKVEWPRPGLRLNFGD